LDSEANNDQSDATVAVWMDGAEVLHYDRNKPVPLMQQAYLTKMDRKMDQGIELDGEVIAEPDKMQRAEFVAAQLVSALRNGDDSLAAATCTYLADRFPELKAIRCGQNGSGATTELVFE
jgi:hypothetical protein